MSWRCYIGVWASANMSKEFPKKFGKTSEKFGIGASEKVFLVTVL